MFGADSNVRQQPTIQSSLAPVTSKPLAKPDLRSIYARSALVKAKLHSSIRPAPGYGLKSLDLALQAGRGNHSGMLQSNQSQMARPITRSSVPMSQVMQNGNYSATADRNYSLPISGSRPSAQSHGQIHDLEIGHQIQQSSWQRNQSMPILNGSGRAMQSSFMRPSLHQSNSASASQQRLYPPTDLEAMANFQGRSMPQANQGTVRAGSQHKSAVLGGAQSSSSNTTTMSGANLRTPANAVCAPVAMGIPVSSAAGTARHEIEKRVFSFGRDDHTSSNPIRGSQSQIQPPRPQSQSVGVPQMPSQHHSDSNSTEEDAEFKQKFSQIYYAKLQARVRSSGANWYMSAEQEQKMRKQGDMLAEQYMAYQKSKRQSDDRKRKQLENSNSQSILPQAQQDNQSKISQPLQNDLPRVDMLQQAGPNDSQKAGQQDYATKIPSQNHLAPVLTGQPLQNIQAVSPAIPKLDSENLRPIAPPNIGLSTESQRTQAQASLVMPPHSAGYNPSTNQAAPRVSDMERLTKTLRQPPMSMLKSHQMQMALPPLVHQNSHPTSLALDEVYQQAGTSAQYKSSPAQSSQPHSEAHGLAQNAHTPASSNLSRSINPMTMTSTAQHPFSLVHKIHMAMQQAIEAEGERLRNRKEGQQFDDSVRLLSSDSADKPSQSKASDINVETEVPVQEKSTASQKTEATSKPGSTVINADPIVLDDGPSNPIESKSSRKRAVPNEKELAKHKKWQSETSAYLKQLHSKRLKLSAKWVTGNNSTEAQQKEQHTVQAAKPQNKESDDHAKDRADDRTPSTMDSPKSPDVAEPQNKGEEHQADERADTPVSTPKSPQPIVHRATSIQLEPESALEHDVQVPDQEASQMEIAIADESAVVPEPNLSASPSLTHVQTEVCLTNSQNQIPELRKEDSHGINELAPSVVAPEPDELQISPPLQSDLILEKQAAQSPPNKGVKDQGLPRLSQSAPAVQEPTDIEHMARSFLLDLHRGINSGVPPLEAETRQQETADVINPDKPTKEICLIEAQIQTEQPKNPSANKQTSRPGHESYLSHKDMATDDGAPSNLQDARVSVTSSLKTQADASDKNSDFTTVEQLKAQWAENAVRAQQRREARALLKQSSREQLSPANVDFGSKGDLVQAIDPTSEDQKLSTKLVLSKAQSIVLENATPAQTSHQHHISEADAQKSPHNDSDDRNIDNANNGSSHNTTRAVVSSPQSARSAKQWNRHGNVSWPRVLASVPKLSQPADSNRIALASPFSKSALVPPAPIHNPEQQELADNVQNLRDSTELLELRPMSVPDDIILLSSDDDWEVGCLTLLCGGNSWSQLHEPCWFLLLRLTTWQKDCTGPTIWRFCIAWVTTIQCIQRVSC